MTARLTNPIPYPSSSGPQPGWLALTLPVLTAIVLYSLNITDDLFGDEFATYVYALRQDPTAMDPERASTSLFFLALSKLGAGIVGEPWGLRLPSVAWGAGTVILVGVLARQLLGWHYQLLATWVAALSPLLIEFGSEARSYTLTAFWGTALLCSLIAFVRNETGRTTVALALSASIGLFGKTIFAVNLAFGAAFYLLMRRRITGKALLAATVVLPVLVYSIALLTGYDNLAPKPEEGVREVSTLNFLLRSVVAFTFGYNTFAIPQLDAARNVGIIATLKANLLPASAIAIAAIAMLPAFFRFLSSHRRSALILIAYVVVPSLLIVIAGQLGFTVLREKFLIGSIGAYLVVLAGTFHEMLPSRLGRVGLAAFAATLLLGFYHGFVKPETYSRRMQHSALNEFLVANARPGDRVVVYNIPPLYRDYPIDYFLFTRPGLPVTDLSDELAGGASLAALADQLSAETSGRLFVIARDPLRSATDPGNEFSMQLRKGRSVQSRSFGRNLNLHTYSAP